MGDTSLVGWGNGLHVAVALLVLILVPGYCLAGLARPRTGRLDHLALALPCAGSLVVVVGLCCMTLHLPFSLLAYCPPAALFVILYVAREARAGRLSCLWTRPASLLWLVAPAVALVNVVVVVLTYASSVIPDASDTVSHTVWTDYIAQSHNFTFRLLSTPPGHGAFYPPGFHALSALIVDATGMPAYHVIVYIALACAVTTPFVLQAYLRASLGESSRLIALAVALSLAFDPWPIYTVATGLYPFSLSYVYIGALVVVLIDGVGRGARASFALAVLLGIGLFYTHPTEFVTVALLGAAAILPLLHGREVWLRAVARSVVVGLVWIVAGLPALSAIRTTIVAGALVEIQARHNFTPPQHIYWGSAVGTYLFQIYGRNLSYFPFVVVVVGLGWCVARRRHLGLVAVQAIMALVFLDVLSLNVLKPFYALSFPWALPERLAPLHYWVEPILAALGLRAVMRELQSLRLSFNHTIVLFLALFYLVFGGVLPLFVTALRAMAATTTYHAFGSGDVDALIWLKQHAHGKVVLNDEDNVTRPGLFDLTIDAGRWMPILVGVRPLFGPGGSGPGPLDTRITLLKMIGGPSLSPTARQALKRDNVGYVYYGAVVLSWAHRHLNLQHLLHAPYLRRVYPSASSCLLTCPASAAVIFEFRS